MLKSLICIRDGELLPEHQHHKISVLLKNLLITHPQLAKINESQDLMLLLDELSQYCIGIRYSQGTICLRPNKNAGNTHPLQEFSVALHEVYSILEASFIEATVSKA